jgi:hypothetical protein
MRFVPTILFVLSILAFGLYIFTGNQIIDDNILLLAIIIGFVGSFVMASFRVKKNINKYVFWGSGVLMMGMVIFFVAMSIFWNQP